MSQSSYGPLFEALAHYNDKLLAMARAQTERTAQALLQTSLDDLGQVLEQGSQQPWQLIQSQMNWWQDQLKLMQHTLLKSAGQPSEPVITRIAAIAASRPTPGASNPSMTTSSNPIC
jgi:polyhydroxyalkanoate synthase